MVLAALIPCSKRAFSDVLEGVALKKFFGDKPHTPSLSPASSTIDTCCEMP